MYPLKTSLFLIMWSLMNLHFHINLHSFVVPTPQNTYVCLLVKLYITFVCLSPFIAANVQTIIPIPSNIYAPTSSQSDHTA